MKKTIVIMAVIAGLLTTGGYAIAEMKHGEHKDAGKHEKKKLQTTCPTKMGAKINKSLYVDHDGKRIYVCCKACVKMVKKDPKKYIKKLEDKGVTVCKAQATCPISGKKIDKKFYADHDGQRVHLCCSDCATKFKKDPAKYIKKLKDEGVALDRVPGAKKKQEKHHDEDHPKKTHQHGK